MEKITLKPYDINQYYNIYTNKDSIYKKSILIGGSELIPILQVKLKIEKSFSINSLYPRYKVIRTFKSESHGTQTITSSIQNVYLENDKDIHVLSTSDDIIIGKFITPVDEYCTIHNIETTDDLDEEIRERLLISTGYNAHPVYIDLCNLNTIKTILPKQYITSIFGCESPEILSYDLSLLPAGKIKIKYAGRDKDKKRINEYELECNGYISLYPLKKKK